MPGKDEKVAKKRKTYLMDQYYAIKERYPDTLLLFRMGDFYELFDEDAKIASKVLGIALTSRNHGLSERTPLAGVPHHALERYLVKLLQAGYRVAICEQLEDPKKAKGLVKRDVIEVMTPGTITVDAGVESDRNQYLVGVLPSGDVFHICAVDVLSGEFFTNTIPVQRFLDELAILEPSEILLPDDITEPILRSIKERFPKVAITLFEPWNFERQYAERVLTEHFGTVSLEGFGELSSNEIAVAGAVLAYLKSLKKGKLSHIKRIGRAPAGNVMRLDGNTIRNLELVRSISDGTKYGTLLWTLDETKTPMGARLLRRWILSPLTDRQMIIERLDAVDSLVQSGMLLAKLREYLEQMGDLERIAGKLGNMKINPRDIVALAKSLEVVGKIRELKVFNSPLLAKIREKLDPHDDVRKRIEETIVANPPAVINEGGIIRPGVIPELDELRSLKADSDSAIRNMVEKLRTRTGLDKLRIGYNKVFGYYIEIPKAQARKAPPDFIRKQTLVNAERFITPELKELENKILAADERIKYIEREFFLSLVAELSTVASEISDVAQAVAMLDVLADFAHIAKKKRYTRPVISDDGKINIKDGRHPVLEDIMGRNAYVPNDLSIGGDTQIIILTGPNMAGKSTYLRQNGLIVLMAQIGSFVPAESAHITPVDRIFTRVGAVDYIAYGQSTFLVEMLETANILNNATENSLVLLDEIGRGTSTFDGLAIAWAVVEYLHNTKGHRAKTIFATHYHELTETANYLERVKNFQVAVRERGGKVVFLHKIVPGGCDDSYGIQVAKLAGVPDDVVVRAKEILEVLESGETPKKGVIRIGGKKPRTEKYAGYQLSLFDPELHPLVVELRKLDLDNITPLQALQILAEWRKKWE